MEREEQRRMLEERLVTAVADEYRYGAICDLDYGGRPEKERELNGAEERAQEIREIARDFGLELPAEAQVDERARAAVREEYEGAADALAGLLATPADGGSGRAGADTEARADPYALFDAEERARDAEGVLRYLDDVEANRRFREALDREMEGEAAEALRAAGYPAEKVARFVQARPDADAGLCTEEASERHRLNAGDLGTYLEERARTVHAAGQGGPQPGRKGGR